MHIGVCRISAHLPEATNLKEKRQIARSLPARLRNQFNVAVAEVDHNDLWQRLTIGVCCISNDTAHAHEMMSKIVSFVEEFSGDLILLDYETELITGV